MSVNIVNATFNADFAYFYDWTNAVNDSTVLGATQNTIALYQLGCLADDDSWDGTGDGGWDCFSACQNATKLFNSTWSGYVSAKECRLTWPVSRTFTDHSLSPIDITQLHRISNRRGAMEWRQPHRRRHQDRKVLRYSKRYGYSNVHRIAWHRDLLQRLLQSI